MPSEHTAAELNTLRAEAEYERREADALLDAVTRITEKAEKSRYAHDNALEQLANAKADAYAANERAAAAEQKADDAGAPPVAVPSMTVQAQPTL